MVTFDCGACGHHNENIKNTSRHNGMFMGEDVACIRCGSLHETDYQETPDAIHEYVTKMAEP